MTLDNHKIPEEWKQIVLNILSWIEISKVFTNKLLSDDQHAFVGKELTQQFEELGKIQLFFQQEKKTFKFRFYC